MKTIPIIFIYNRTEYSFNLVLESEPDFWTTLYKGNIIFDVHYCEDYNEISLYVIDNDTLETNYNITVHSQPIFSKKEYTEKYDDKVQYIEKFKE